MIGWRCADCGIEYNASADAGRQIADTDRYQGHGPGRGNLPQFCPECGDHRGWTKLET